MFSKPHECLMFYCFPLDFCCCFGGISRQTEIINWLWHFMFYRMGRICKITQWQHCSICWQQASHVEIYVALIKATSHVR